MQSELTVIERGLSEFHCCVCNYNFLVILLVIFFKHASTAKQNKGKVRLGSPHNSLALVCSFKPGTQLQNYNAHENP